MEIHINGLPHHLEKPVTIETLLAELELAGRRLAIEINGEILPRSAYHSTLLNENDQLEIVHAIGGG